MLNKKTKFSLILTVFIGSILMFSGVTSADFSVQIVATGNQLSATTLQMSALETSNESNLPLLFQITGLIPGGFSVKSLRLKKTANLDFNYQLKSIKINGDDNLYQSLNLKIMQKDKFIYQGKLADLNRGQTINPNGQDDWIFFISLDQDNSELTNKTCEFTFDFKTYRDNPDETGGFQDEIKVINYISSGNW